jgi:radical SAM protein with 4Fe4S-binding SPASM domain
MEISNSLADQLDYRNKKLADTSSNLLGLVEVELNLTELCNRACSFCPRHDPKIYPNLNLHMSLSTLNKIKEQLSLNSFNGSIILSGFGEPTLYKHLATAVALFSEYRTELITSGDLFLSNKIKIQDLFDLGLKYITINDYDNNPLLKELASQYSSVRIRLHHDDNTDRFKEYGFNNRGGTLWKLSAPVPRPCYVSAYRAVFDWNGDLLLCDHDWSKHARFGNINHQPLKALWYDKKFLEYRKSLYLGNRNISPACSNCSINGTLVGNNYARLWIDSF